MDRGPGPPQPDRTPGRSGVAAILLDQDPEFTELLRDLFTVYAEDLRTQIEHDIDVGELRADLDTEAAVILVVGAWAGARLRVAAPGEDWVDRFVDTLWPSFRP